MRHLYIHIPFCHRRCSYCDFNTYANMEHRIEAYTEALCAELRMLAEQLPAWPHRPESGEAAALRPTIFLGGGTPTMLSLQQMERVLAAADAIVPLAGAEVSSEANPGTVLGKDYLAGLRALGVNRLSMGVQSLHDPTLRVLGRIHSAEEARRSYVEAREAGFDNINLDFIFGLPGQTVAQWRESLAELVRWEVDHFALYSLILEEQTPLYAQVTSGRVVVPDDDETGAMYEAAMEILGAGGYQHYEISNWTLGKPCDHNLAYWLNSDYLAAGAGAHGHVFPTRYYDILAIDDYIAAVGAGRLPVAETIDLDEGDLRAETMFMGLRLQRGVSRQHFRQRTGAELADAYGDTLAALAGRGLIEQDPAGVRLTPRGRMLGNQVFAAFV